jgi:superfamily II DNA or RNA helicase
MELAQFFNRQKVTLQVPGYDSPITYLQDEGYLAHVQYEYIRYRPGNEISLTQDEIRRLQSELDLPQSVILRLGEDHKRNCLIITKLIEEAKTGCKIIVFACSVEHAHILAGILAAKGFRAAAVTSQTNPARRRQLIADYRQPLGVQILCNYGVLTTGFDAPKTKCALIARPTQSVVLYSQMVGRAARGPRAGGNEQCKIITVVDQLPGFRSVAEAFEYFEEIWQ